MNKFNKRLGGFTKLLHLLNKSSSSSSPSSLARLYSISFSIVKGSPLSTFNQETGSSKEAQIFSLRKNNADKAPEQVETKQTINLTKYGSNRELKGIKPIPIQAKKRDSSIRSVPIETKKEHIESSNNFLAYSARILLNNRNFEDVINLIKSSCIKDENGNLDYKAIASQEAGVEVLLKLHQAYAEMKNLEEMNKIIEHVTNPLMYNKFQGEIINYYAANDNHTEALKLLDQMSYIPYWNLIFLRVTKCIVYRIPESTHGIITFLNQYIENHKHEINKIISDPSQHLQGLPPNFSARDVVLRIRKFFDATGYVLDRIRFAKMTIEAFSILEDHNTMDILFNILIDKNDTNADVLSTLKGIMMHSLITLGRYEDALSVFFDIKTPTTNRTYEKLMRVYIDMGHYDFAIYLCETFVKNPTPEIYVLLIKAHIMKGNIEKAELILNDIFENSNLTDTTLVIVKTLLMSAYAEAGMIQQVQKLFDSIEKPDARCYNELMKAYSHMGDTKRVKEIFTAIPSKDGVSFLYLLDSLALDGDATTALKFYNLIPNPNHFHADAVVRALIQDAKNGDMSAATNFFSKLRNPSIMTRKRILRGISKSGDLEEALHFFKTIPNPDTESFGILLRTYFYTDTNNLHQAEEFFSRIPNPDAQCYASMISIYGRAGRIDMVDKMLEQYPSPSTVIAFFYSYFTNSPADFWEKYEALVAKYPRCFTKPVYIEAIKEAVKYKKKKHSVDMFRIYMERIQNKQTRDLLGLLLFIAKESTYRENLKLVTDILEAVPKCITTPNTLGQIKEITFEIEQLK